jgi:dolichol kinase
MDPTTQSFMMTHAVVRDVVATVLTISGSLLWVKLFDELARREILEAKLSRKLVHVTSGTFFAMTWCLFGDQWYSKAFATLVPSLQAFRLFAIGSGLIENKNAVRAVSRGGGKEELLYGPFYYTIVLMVTTLLFWRESPVGFLVVSLMCGGDGGADIVGRRLGKTGKKWPKPFDERKSFAGSAAMVIAGFLFTVSLTHLFGVMGFFPNNRVFGGPDDIGYYAVILLACLSCAVVEALPASKVDDNISVAAVAALLGSLAFL